MIVWTSSEFIMAAAPRFRAMRPGPRLAGARAPRRPARPPSSSTSAAAGPSRADCSRASGGASTPQRASSPVRGEHLAGRPVQPDLALAEQDDPGRAAGQPADVVGDGDDGDPGAGPDPVQQPQERPHVVGVLPGGRLVEDEHAGGTDQQRRRAPAAAGRPGSAPTGCPPPARGSRRTRSPPARPAPGPGAGRGTGSRTPVPSARSSRTACRRPPAAAARPAPRARRPCPAGPAGRGTGPPRARLAQADRQAGQRATCRSRSRRSSPPIRPRATARRHVVDGALAVELDADAIPGQHRRCREVTGARPRRARRSGGTRAGARAAAGRQRGRRTRCPSAASAASSTDSGSGRPNASGHRVRQPDHVRDADADGQPRAAVRPGAARRLVEHARGRRPSAPPGRPTAPPRPPGAR